MKINTFNYLAMVACLNMII